MSEIAVAAGVDTDPLDVSFVVIASNEAAHVAATTAPIPGQENLGHHVIVVVEDGSTDATAAVVERLAAVDRRPRLLRHGGSVGRGAVRATGATAARAARIAMVDADILLPPRWWARCRDTLRGADPVGVKAVRDGAASHPVRSPRRQRGQRPQPRARCERLPVPADRRAARRAPGGQGPPPIPALAVPEWCRRDPSALALSHGADTGPRGARLRHRGCLAALLLLAYFLGRIYGLTLLLSRHVG